MESTLNSHCMHALKKVPLDSLSFLLQTTDRHCWFANDLLASFGLLECRLVVLVAYCWSCSLPSECTIFGLLLWRSPTEILCNTPEGCGESGLLSVAITALFIHLLFIVMAFINFSIAVPLRKTSVNVFWKTGFHEQNWAAAREHFSSEDAVFPFNLQLSCTVDSTFSWMPFRIHTIMDTTIYIKHTPYRSSYAFLWGICK